MSPLPPSQPSAAAADDKRNDSRASRRALPPPSSLHGGAPYLLPFPCSCGGGGRQAQRLEGLSVCPPSTFLLAWWRALPPPFPYRCVGGGRQAQGGASKASGVSKAGAAAAPSAISPLAMELLPGGTNRDGVGLGPTDLDSPGSGATTIGARTGRALRSACARGGRGAGRWLLVFCGGAPAAQQLEQPRRARPPPPHSWPSLDLRMKTASGGESDRANSPALGDASPSPVAAGGAPGGGPCFFSLVRRW
jgi:hypothetical protein